MLILTRRPVEAINIGEEIVLTVLGVTGGQVRFGIDAPRSIPVDRAEVFERKRRKVAEEAARASGRGLRPESVLPAPQPISCRRLG
jgi:carbon storage regulator